MRNWNWKRRFLFFSKYKDKEGEQIVQNPTRGSEILLKNATLYTRGLRFETLELRTREAETTYEGSLNVVEWKKWVLFRGYMGRGMYQIRIRGNPPVIRPERLITAVLANSKEPYEAITVTDWNSKYVGFRSRISGDAHWQGQKEPHRRDFAVRLEASQSLCQVVSTYV